MKDLAFLAAVAIVMGGTLISLSTSQPSVKDEQSARAHSLPASAPCTCTCQPVPVKPTT